MTILYFNSHTVSSIESLIFQESGKLQPRSLITLHPLNYYRILSFLNKLCSFMYSPGLCVFKM